MKILIAGASGAIGRPLISLLLREGHDLYGITQSQEKGQKMAAEGDATLRREGGANLLAAAQRYGARRYLAQSSAFWYAPGEGLADETAPFAFDATPGIASGTRLYAEIEDRILHSPAIEGVALRFGFFYGPGTWFYPGGDVANQIHEQRFPIIGRGEGVWNFVHIEDAAAAIVAAISGKADVYNITNDQPLEMARWLPAFAHYLNAPPPPILTEQEGLKLRGDDALYYATKLRGASNAKAKQALNFKPRPLEWIYTEMS